jgi:CubicO group peptidase (beta-lactamase class C family)
MTRFCVALIAFLALALSSSAQVGELPRSTPEAEGVDTALLNSFYHAITTLPDVDVHHLMVLRHGKVIGELHATPYRATDLHTLYSASKTVTGLAVGLAVALAAAFAMVEAVIPLF